MIRYSCRFAAIALLFAAWAVAAEQAYQEGVSYERVTPPQPTENPNKIEVMEFFWYGCPHCYRFEPHLEAWLQDLPEDVYFIRQPAVFSPLWKIHAKAYFAAQALGVVDKVHADFYNAIQNQRRPLKTEDELAKFFAEQGVDEKRFRNAFHSFLVDTKLRQAETMSARYGVTGVPAVIINGKYRTNGPLAKSYPNMVSIMNYLIEKERTAEK